MSARLLYLDRALGAGDPDDGDKTFGMPLADRLWRTIVSDAVRGRLTPGQRLRESFVERTYGAGRLLVRETLRTLETRGIIVKAPHSGCRVMDVD